MKRIEWTDNQDCIGELLVTLPGFVQSSLRDIVKVPGVWATASPQHLRILESP